MSIIFANQSKQTCQKIHALFICAFNVSCMTMYGAIKNYTIQIYVKEGDIGNQVSFWYAFSMTSHHPSLVRLTKGLFTVMVMVSQFSPDNRRCLLDL